MGFYCKWMSDFVKAFFFLICLDDHVVFVLGSVFCDMFNLLIYMCWTLLSTQGEASYVMKYNLFNDRFFWGGASIISKIFVSKLVREIGLLFSFYYDFLSFSLYVWSIRLMLVSRYEFIFFLFCVIKEFEEYCS